MGPGQDWDMGPGPVLSILKQRPGQGAGTGTWGLDRTGTWDLDGIGTWDLDGTGTCDRDMGPGRDRTFSVYFFRTGVVHIETRTRSWGRDLNMGPRRDSGQDGQDAVEIRTSEIRTSMLFANSTGL